MKTRFLILWLGLCLGMAAQAALRVPAFTAYLDPDPDGARVSEKSGVTRWDKPETKVLWFGELKNTGKLECAVTLRLKENAESKLRLTVGGETHHVAAQGDASGSAKADFGTFSIAAPGYQRFTLASDNPVNQANGDVEALVLDGPAAKDAHFNLKPRRNAASVHLAYPVGKETQVSAFYGEMTGLEDPVWTYYMACGWHRGYFGMQVNSPTERRIIFSVWDSGNEGVDRKKVAADDRVTLVNKGEGVYSGDFGNEGTGGHSHLIFPWKTGEKQRFMVTAQPTDATHTVYSGYYFRPDKQEWMLISSWKAPKEGGYLRGLYSFSENFGGANGHVPRKALYGNQWIRTTGGQWIELTTASFSHDPTGKADRLDRFMGIENGQFFLSHGGFRPGYTAYGEKFTRPATGREPHDFPWVSAAEKSPVRSDWLIQPASYKAKIIRRADGREIELNNGLARRVFRLRPDGATVSLDNLANGESLLRSVRPEAVVEINGNRCLIGGLTGQPAHNFIKPEWLDTMKLDAKAWHCVSVTDGKTSERFAWKPRREWLSADTAWPPPGVSLAFDYAAPAGSPLTNIMLRVHYELYDGVPLFSKWLTLHNGSAAPVVLNSFLVEQLAVVEPESIVDGTAANFRGTYRGLDVFSDYAFGGNMTANADAPAVSWKIDPLYESQVHYERKTPCLLECAPPIGPDARIEPGGEFATFRVFELLQDGTDRERRGLATRHAYRLLAPWVQENPILMHVRSAKPEAVKLAIDQCADLGFEMAIMTFGSGFDIENEKPEYLAQIKELVDYGRAKGVALGGYSLLASRSINADNDVLNPQTGKTGGARFGNSPCIGSSWGQDYFRKLRNFYETTGCAVLEHDGSYPGDVCASTNHPGHRGLNDSQWTQWRVIAEFYQWCRARGIYLNVPDWYYLAGSTKCGMGYRETNWSLPRDQQEIIERQNIFDGTWEKTPSMGWMFVPLVEYQGGGAAATIEPLREHLDHYEARLANLFGAGVQACYRGPRLYDAPETRAVVKRWVDFYRQHRAILDSDLIHLRRPDGRDWDGWLHVNPRLPERALAVFYNPLTEPIERKIRLPLYYAGLTQEALVTFENGTHAELTLDRDYKAEVMVKIPAKGRTWMVIK